MIMTQNLYIVYLFFQSIISLFLLASGIIIIVLSKDATITIGFMIGLFGLSIFIFSIYQFINRNNGQEFPSREVINSVSTEATTEIEIV
jgi:uncharacterized Tic20 family protein